MNRLFIALLAGVAIVSSGATAGTDALLNKGTGVETAIYSAGDETAQGVVIVHDWFGMSPAMRGEADWLAGQGLHAVVIDLYGGKSATTHAEAEKLMKGLDQAKAAEKIKAALTALGAEKSPVAIIGYSMGGGIALKAQIANQSMVNAGVLVYGGGYEEMTDADLKGLKSPVLVISGSKDGWSFAALTALQTRTASLENPVATFVYPNADHAYVQPLFNEGKNYNKAATDVTHSLIAGFVKSLAEAM
jgi:carboxymethylenebutenolidase